MRVGESRARIFYLPILFLVFFSGVARNSENDDREILANRPICIIYIIIGIIVIRCCLLLFMSISSRRCRRRRCCRIDIDFRNREARRDGSASEKRW